MELTLKYDGKTLINMAVSELLAAGVPAAVIGAAAKAHATAQVTTMMDGYRVRVSTPAAGRVAEWFFKEQDARDPENARAEEMAILDREAAARGIDRDQMLALIITKANAFREIALLIGAIEAEAKAAVATIPDDADDIETQIHNTLAAAKAQAKTAFNEAITLINGGS